MKKWLLLCFWLFVSDSVLAQVDFTTLLNTSSAANLVPFSSTATRKIRTLYRPGDFTSTPFNGNIDTLFLASASGSGSGVWSNLIISLGQTSDTVLSSTQFTSGLTLVALHPSFAIPSVSGNQYFALPLQQPFAYDATQSLIVEISYNERTSGSGFSVRSNTLTGRNVTLSGSLQASTSGTLGAAQRTLGISVASLPANDASIVGVVSPVAPFLPSTPTQVGVQIQNNGTTTMSSIDLQYQLGNQPVVSQNFAIALAPFQRTSLTFSPTLTLPSTNDVLRIWVNAVNGASDANAFNDTAIQIICPPLAGGVYNLGGANADFPTWQTLINRLSCSGISGNVVIQIASGTYQGPFRFGSILGSGLNSTITFAPANAQTADVTLLGTATEEALSFTGTNGVILNNLRFVRRVAPTIAVPLLLSNGSVGMQFNQLEFVDSVRTLSANNQALLVEGGTAVVVSASRFVGFGDALRFNAIAGAPGVSHRAEANHFEQYLLNGIWASQQSSLAIVRNRLLNFRGATNTGAGILVQNSQQTLVEANRIGGDLGRSGLEITNANAGPNNAFNLIANNEISGRTFIGGGNTGLTRGALLTGSAADGRDAVVFAHNSISFTPLGNNTANGQALLVIDGGTGATQPFDNLTLANNMLVEPLLGAQSPNNFSIMSFTNRATVDSTVFTSNNYHKNIENIQGTAFRVLAPAQSFTTYPNWRSSVAADSLSRSVQPLFVADSLLIPVTLALDNAGSAVAGITTDLTGQTRSASTPDIGAYEFTGLSLSSLQFTPLANTIDTLARPFQVVVNDSTGLVLTGQNSPRLYYRKRGQSTFAVDSVPLVTANAYTFNFQPAPVGGFAARDTIEYYLAVRNNTGAVTTAPLGGSGINPVGNQAPASLLSYQIVPSAQGTYRVGSGGDFPTLTAAAAFMNAAIFTGNATFLLIDTLYSSAEQFPIVFTRNASRNSNRTVVIRPDSGIVTTIRGNLTGNAPALLIGQDVNDWTLQGSWAGATASRLTLTSPSSTTSTALIQWIGNADLGTLRTAIRSVRFLGANAEVNLQFGLVAGGQGISASSEGEHRFLEITHNHFERLWQGVYVRGTSNRLAYGTRISHNFFGNADSTLKIGVRAIQLQNTDSTLVSDNVMRNIRSPLAAAKVGILTALVNNQLQILRNDIRVLAHTQFTGVLQGAHGIFINGGNAVLIANNVIADIKTGNVGNSSFDAAIGIRLSSGAGHRLYYNTVHLFGLYDQPSTGGASAAALAVTATSVNNLDVRNNIFSNNLRSISPSTGVYFAALWFVQNYTFGNSTFNHNAYAVGDTTQTLLARFSTLLNQVFVPDLPAFRAISQLNNAANDTASLPAIGKEPARFVSNEVLTIDTAQASTYESAGTPIAFLGLPNTDIRGLARPAFGGTAPDLGAYEFGALSAGDVLAPELVTVSINPAPYACAPTARTIGVVLNDERGLAQVQLLYRIGSGAFQNLSMNLDTGSVRAGRWLATVPAAALGVATHVFLVAADSIGNATVTLRLATLRDGGLLVSTQNDTTLRFNAPFGRTATGNAGGLRLTEVFYNRILTGAQTNYPAGFPTASSQVAVELSNTSKQSLSLSGKSLQIEGFWNLDFALPAITLDSGQTVTLVAGSNSGNATNRIFGWGTAGGASPFNSSNVVGIWVSDTLTQEVIDAVSINGHSFSQKSGVNLFDFSGSVTASNRASIQRTGMAARNAQSWRTSETNAPSTIGSYNTDLRLDPGDYSWTYLATGQRLDSVATANFIAPASGAYSLSYTDGICTIRDTFNILLQFPDLAITRIVSPSAGSAQNQATAVRVMVRNVGTAPIQRLVRVRYRANQLPVTVATDVNLNLQVGDSVEVRLNPDFNPIAGGAVQLCVFLEAIPEDQSQSNDTLCVQFSSTVSVAHDRFSGVKLYPNPANDRAQVAGLPENSRVQLFALTGALVWEGSNAEGSQLDIPLLGLPSGIYQVVVQQQGYYGHYKLVKR